MGSNSKKRPSYVIVEFHLLVCDVKVLRFWRLTDAYNKEILFKIIMTKSLC